MGENDNPRIPADPQPPPHPPGDGPTGAGGAVPPAPPAPGPAAAGPPPRRHRHRYVISQRLAPYGDDRTLRRDMVEVFSMRLDRHLLPNADLVADLGADAAARSERRVVVIDADPAEIAVKTAALTADALVEPEKPRRPLVVGRPLPFALDGIATPGPGRGGELRLTLRGPDDEPVAGATVVVLFTGRQDPAARNQAGGLSDAAGGVAIAYDPDAWLVDLASVTPHSGYWSEPVTSPQSGQTVRLTRLPSRGPFGWWQWVSGAAGFDLLAGQGLTVGVIDTGAGPHPCLDHVEPLGAFIDGIFLPGASAGQDVASHGTHVTGLIAARPAPGSGQYGGLAPGAAVKVVRVFPPDRSANQGDIAMAVRTLSSQHAADLINLSLGGEASDIERDAIILARRSGTLCIAASGNDGGRPPDYPAAYPECAAVSALGMLGCAPAGSTAASFQPAPGLPLGTGGLFCAPFSNIGPDLACTAPGVAIVSTVPVVPGGDAAPYAEMNGTSMAAPLATGTLAACLSQDKAYLALPRAEARAAHAAAVLAAKALPIGLPQIYEGRGLARAR